MKLLPVIIITLVLMQSTMHADSLWNRGHSLFSEHKARKVGDIVTIVISESASAQQKATTTNKESTQNSVSAGKGFMKFLPLGTAGTANTYNGNGTTNRSNSFRATITARIMEVLPNGTYMIEGSRKLSLNNEIEEIEVKGIVRDEDIDRDNMVESSKLAEADIHYEGRGVVTDSQKPGILQRLFHSIF